MKKIGIITLNGNNNYGNKLQHYAVQTVLEKSNYKVETIRCIYNTNFFMYYLKHLLKILLKKRYRAFLKFDKMINYYPFNYYYSNINDKKLNINDKFNYFIVGSDQVWNSSIKCFNELFLLSFANKEKRISFSASFGIDKIESSKNKMFTDELLKFKGISVREESGKKIVDDLTKRKDVEVLVDPTMLLNSGEWDKVSRKPKMHNDCRYILCYFLGDIKEEWQEQINQISNNKNIKLINVLDTESPYCEMGPSEFLYLIKNSEFVLTDSFHACVFSIIYNKPFIVFDRSQKGLVSINSRIETLLSKFHLEDRKYKNKLDDSLYDVDYTDAMLILEQEKKKSEKFLENNL